MFERMNQNEIEQGRGTRQGSRATRQKLYKIRLLLQCNAPLNHNAAAAAAAAATPSGAAVPRRPRHNGGGVYLLRARHKGCSSS